MKSKQTKQMEKLIRLAFLAVLAISAYKCTGQDQDFRVNTAVGLILFTESNNADEICFSFGVQSGEVAANHLSKTADTLPGRIAAAAKMADDAFQKYPDFLRENRLNDSPSIQTYYAKCRAIRRQFLSVMPECAIAELHFLTQKIR